ncbi:MAG TPA: SulP family inorganic anion transporter [Vicinamibacterales bacterium]|nr:SulP family inorganic anion transporter [Vicinamibacterales bacterium]
MKFSRWTPASFVVLKDYSLTTFAHDLGAGVTVGLVALPLAMAFAIASGLTPQAGIYCAVITGFLISALGGSRYQIGGPTGAFVVVVAGIVAEFGVSGLYLVTMMAGVMLMILGVTGMGTAVNYLPRPVVIGFTNGIAVLIASTQIRDFFGLQISDVPSEFAARMGSLVEHAGTISPAATVLGLVSLATILALRKAAPRVPGTIVALLGGTAAAALLGLDLETIGSRFGGIPAGLPAAHFPAFEASLIPALVRPALTVAMLGAIESLMSAVVADRMGNDRHNPNMELVGQGVANIVSPIFGGLPATGAIARTATNIRAGARTPVAGMIHAIVLLIILVAAAPLAQYIPMALLAAILFIVAYNMGEWHEIPQLLKLTKTDISVWLVTFALTVFADLTLAVEVGMILAALLYIRRVSSTTTVSMVTSEYIESGRAHSLQDKNIPSYVAIFRIHGPLLFGVTDKVNYITDHVERLPPIVIVRLRNMTAIDATGLKALEEVADRLHASGRTLLLCGAREQPAAVMKQAEFHQHVGERNICANILVALQRAEELNRAAA